MFLLDTNVVSEMRKAGTPRVDSGVASWVTVTNATDMFLSAIVVEELEVGVLRALRRNPQFGATLRYWLDKQVLPNFRDRILPVDMAVALAAAPMQVPVNRPFRDSLIAATALVHGLTVVTRNITDFASLGVPVINPWNG